MELEQLKKQKDKYINQIFWLGLKIALIFGIPAFFGAYIGIRLDRYYNTNRSITYGILFFTFIFSWFLVIWEYKKISKKLRKVDDEIKNIKD